jgi:hypothetical protein
MTRFQEGQAAHARGVCRFDNPHKIGTVDWLGWRRGWDCGADARRMAPVTDGFARLASRGTSPIDGRTFNHGSY